MYGMEMVFGGWLGPRFEAALERAVGGLGYAVATRAAPPTREDYHRWLASPVHAGRPPGTSYWEPPSLLFYRGGETNNGPPWVALEVRGIRPPPWNIRLARAVSGALGGFGLAYINDRLRDEYGHGAFFAGCTLEAAAYDHRGVTVRTGIDAARTDAAICKDCDEHENRDRHGRYVRAIASPGDWPRFGAKDAPLTAWTLRPLPGLAADPPPEPGLVRVVIAGGDAGRLRRALEGAPSGFRERLDAAWPLHDPFALDPETYEIIAATPAPYLSMEAPSGTDPGPVLDHAERLGLAAVAVELRGEGRPSRFWSRAADGGRGAGEALGAEAFFAVWTPVCKALATGPAQLCWPDDPPPAPSTG